MSFTGKTRRAILNFHTEGSQPHVLSRCVGGRLRISWRGLLHAGVSPRTQDGNEKAEQRERRISGFSVEGAPWHHCVLPVL